MGSKAKLAQQLMGPHRDEHILHPWDGSAPAPEPAWKITVVLFRCLLSGVFLRALKAPAGQSGVSLVVCNLLLYSPFPCLHTRVWVERPKQTAWKSRVVASCAEHMLDKE